MDRGVVTSSDALVFASGFLFAYDWLLNLDDEVFCIWTRPWRWGKIAYVWTRSVCLGYVLLQMILTSISVFIKPKGSLFFAVFRIAPVPFILMVYISCQAILCSRVLALYGNKKNHLIGFIVLCCVVPVIVPVVQLPFIGILSNAALLIHIYTYSILGLLTDAFLLALILVHAVRNRRLFALSQDRSSLGRIRDSGSGLFTLIVSDSVRYYAITLTMYIVSFILARSYVRMQSNEIEAETEDIHRQFVGDSLVTLMTVLTAILAPKLLLNVRMDVYTNMEPDRTSSTPLRVGSTFA